jgi:hypothetical protein
MLAHCGTVIGIGTGPGGPHIFNAFDEDGISSQFPPRDDEHDGRIV